MKYYICAPGLPCLEDEFMDMKPTSVITEGAIRHICLWMMERNNAKCAISLSPIDMMNLVSTSVPHFAIFHIDSTLQDGEISLVRIMCGEEKVLIKALSPYVRKNDLCALPS